MEREVAPGPPGWGILRPMKKIAVLGSGQVGQVLADGFLKHGHEVMRGSRDPGKMASWKEGKGGKAHTGSVAEAARFAEIGVLAVKGTAATDVIKACEGGLDGKTVLDATNPIADAPPEERRRSPSSPGRTTR